VLKNNFKEDRDGCKKIKIKIIRLEAVSRKLTVNNIKMAADETKFSEHEKISPHLFLSRWSSVHVYRARIFRHLWSSGIDSKE
jgi:hypothetical protein